MTSEKKSFLLSQLQQAIDDAVSESGRVNEIVEEMKRSGFDLCLMLESTVTISPTGDHQPDAVPEPRLTSTDGELKLSIADLEFLDELSIAA
jgi:hypothetical protein